MPPGGLRCGDVEPVPVVSSDEDPGDELVQEELVEGREEEPPLEELACELGPSSPAASSAPASVLGSWVDAAGSSVFELPEGKRLRLS